MTNFSFGQQIRTSFIPNPPPSQANYNGWSYGFKRGLYVDCANDLIQDMKNGNFASEVNLQNYVNTNFIDQIVLFGLDNNIVVGNPSLEPILRTFLTDMRAMFPGINIGAAASATGFLNNTDPFFLSATIHAFCEDGPQGKSVSEIENLMNAPQNARQRQEAEMLKSVCRLAAFSGDNKDPQYNGWEIPETCFPAFDFLFIEVEYWSNDYPTVPDKNAAYNNLKDCLYLGQKLKCKFNCIRNIDAEFNPRDIAAYSGPLGNYLALPRKTQIKECDFLIDQVMLVNYVTPSVAALSFNYKCDVLKEFADHGTKKHSQIIIAYSAEDPSYIDCHGQNMQYYLGQYLDGTDPANTGNMYSVEQDFVNLLEVQSYRCPLCNCTTFSENHFTNTSLDANEIAGSIWFVSSIMMSHNLSRQSNTTISSKEIAVSCYPNPSGEFSTISLSNSIINSIEIVDLSGKQVYFKQIGKSETTINNSSLINGVYQIHLSDNEGNLYTSKYVVVK